MPGKNKTSSQYWFSKSKELLPERKPVDRWFTREEFYNMFFCGESTFYYCFYRWWSDSEKQKFKESLLPNQRRIWEKKAEQFEKNA